MRDGLRDRKFEGHRLFLRDSGAPAGERRLFHGTAGETVVKILRQVVGGRMRVCVLMRSRATRRVLLWGSSRARASTIVGPC